MHCSGGRSRLLDIDLFGNNKQSQGTVGWGQWNRTQRRLDPA